LDTNRHPVESIAQLRARFKTLPALAREMAGRASVLDTVRELSAAHRELHAKALSHSIARLSAKGDGEPPKIPFAFMILGSGARDEQSIASDQDHAFVYDSDEAHAASYFTELSELTTAVLHEIGYALCDGNVMASNPRWRGSLANFANRLAGYAELPNWEHIRYLLIAADARAVTGDSALADAIRSQAVQAVARSGFIKWKIADQGLAQRVSLTLLGHLRVEQGGLYKGLFPIKEGLYTPLVNSVRVWALSVGLEQPATADRISELVKARVWSEALADSVQDALRTTLAIRIAHHLDLAATDVPLHDYVDPLVLEEPVLEELKRAHRTVRQLQQLTAKHFPRSG